MHFEKNENQTRYYSYIPLRNFSISEVLNRDSRRVSRIGLGSTQPTMSESIGWASRIGSQVTRNLSPFPSFFF